MPSRSRRPDVNPALVQGQPRGLTWGDLGPAHRAEKSAAAIVAGGFGDRGTRGMMKEAQVARERRIPYFGICYGFQWATVEYARNVAGLHDADSTECSPDTPTKLIFKLRDLLGIDDLAAFTPG